MHGNNNSTISDNSTSGPLTGSQSTPPRSSSQCVIEPMLIDELVDGSLPHERYVELLKRLEQTPGAWRQCALAFLEDQTFRQSLRKWKSARKDLASAPLASSAKPTEAKTLPQSSTIPPSRSSKATTGRELESTQLDLTRLGLASPESIELDSPGTRFPGSIRKSLRGLHWSSLASMAACTLLAFGVGWQSHQWGGAGSGTSAIESSALRPPIPEFANTSRAKAAGARNEVANRINRDIATNAPTYEGVDTETIVLDNDLVAELERERIWLPYQDEKGQERIIPIEQVRVRPVALRGF